MNALMQAKILLVDDSIENLQALALILKQHRYAVLKAESGETALDLVDQESPDLIILDIMMPGMDGYEVCKQLKQNEDTSDIPIIFISALSQLDERIKAFDVGGADYLIKPFHIEEVLARVKMHLSRRQQEVEIRRLHEKQTQQNLELGKMVDQRTAQLNRLNHRMAAILASVTDAIILVNADGTIDMTNNRFNELFGYLPDELFGQSITRIASPDFSHSIIDAFHSACAGDTQTHIQVVAVRKDGSTFDIDLSLAPVGIDEQYVVCNCHDITHLKEMERIKDNFISMVTHELRTPIAGILLISKQLMKYYSRMEEEQRLQKIQQLHTQSNIMSELVESVLDISRLEASSRKSAKYQVDMLPIVQGVLGELTLSASEKEQILKFSHDSIPGKVQGDAVDYARIWRNLIGNAIKYTPPERTIHVRLGVIEKQDARPLISSPTLSSLDTLSTHDWMEGLYCVGQVEDTGYGISEDELPHIFERFHRGWAKQSDIPGTGLGLALVKELLLSFGGDIAVESQVNQGSIFTFWVPLLEAK